MTAKRYEAAILDLDGTVYLGDRLIAGADDAVDLLRDRGLDVLFLTNKAIENRDDYCAKLSELGVATTRERIINSGWVAARYVADEYADCEAFIIGEEPLIEELEDAGIDTTVDSVGDLLVVSMDREFDYEKLAYAQRTLAGGAPFLATNPDRTCPTENGAIPDAGGMIGAIEGVTGRTVDTMLGKPSTTMLETALDALEVDPGRCLMVGDRLGTDIEMANRAGMTSVLVRSGVTDDATLAASAVSPDHVLESLADIDAVLE